MHCSKRRYRDKDLALAAMHGIANKNDGRKKPVRTYQFDDCGYWHLTSKQIGEMQQDKLVLKCDWSKIIKKD